MTNRDETGRQEPAFTSVSTLTRKILQLATSGSDRGSSILQASPERARSPALSGSK